MTYQIYNNSYEFKKNKKIFGFDLDGTIIKFNLNTEDYEFQYDNILEKLKEISKNYNIVIITNQNHKKYDLFEKKIFKLLNIFTKNKINISIYVSKKNDIYRKPNIKLTLLIEETYHNKIKYYCGDALGRPNDHSDTDLKFGLNLGIPVFSPEQIFLNKTINKTINNNMSIKYPKLNMIRYNFNYKPAKKEMIIMIGYPASGKSSISNLIQEKGFLNNIYYKIINRDTIKTIDKCIKETQNALKYKMNVIIDNTNPSKENRKKFIDIGKKYGYKIIAIKMNTTRQESIHNNYYRSFIYRKELIPEIVYNIYDSKYQKPSLDENIDKIIEIGINIYDYNYEKYFF
jgi:bifunctional polynucleotide phosphatase/kinase